MTAKLLEVVTVSIIKRSKGVAINIKYSTYLARHIGKGHHNLGSRAATASYVTRKQLYIGDYLCTNFGPCGATHTTPLTDAITSYVTLKGAEEKMLATHEIKTNPKPPKGLAKSCCGVGQHTNLFMLVGYVRKKITDKLLVASSLIGSSICKCRFHKSEE